MKVRHVCVEARFGILVGEEADVGEFVPEDWKIATLAGRDTGVYEYMGPGYKMRQPTVANEYYRLGFGLVLWLGHISGEAADFILSAGRLALMHLAAQAATAHSYILRHCEYDQAWSIEIAEGEIQ